MAVALRKETTQQELYDPFEETALQVESADSPHYLQLCKELVQALLNSMDPEDRGIAQHFLRTRNFESFRALLK